PRLAFILILVFVLYKLARYLPGKILKGMKRSLDEEGLKRAETLSGIMSLTFSIVVLAVGGMVVLGELGVSMGPIIASAGILGLAIGFGAQNLVQDYISGFFLLLEDQIRLGDVVETAGKSGLVEQVTLRMIILRDLAGNVHYIRNGKVDIVTNMSKEYSRYIFDIRVAYREDLDEVMDQIRRVDEDMRQDPEYGPNILSPIEILGVNELGESGVVVRARTTTKPVMQWYVGREFNKRLKKRFDEAGIEIPYPQRTVSFDSDKQDLAASVSVESVSPEAGETQE
ncbi:MAG: mechanosensitive ion channel family protein, partial [Desulfohalobiaceae bacterium]